MKKIMLLLVVTASLHAKKEVNVLDKYINPTTSQAEQPKQGKSFAKLKEDITDGYGNIIKKQAKLCQLMADVNSTIVDQLGVLFTNCSASQQCLRDHRSDMTLFEKQLDAFETILKEQLTRLQKIELGPKKK